MREYTLITPILLMDSIRRILVLNNTSLVNGIDPLTVPYEHALNCAKTLELKTLVYQLEQLGVESCKSLGRLSNMNTLGVIQNKLFDILGTLHLEVDEVNLAVLNNSATSERFNNFDRANLSDTGKLFYEESVKCIRIGAYRATVVNTWAICMDYIQEWILKDPQRLTDFNNKLAIYVKKTTNKQIYSSINTKEDFWESTKCPSERIIIDCIFDTIGEKLHRKIVGALDDRNEYAHANSVSLELEKTNGYISTILDIIEHKKLM